MPFLTTSTVSSADDCVGLLHPTTDYEVRLVSCRGTTFPPLPDSPHKRMTLRSFPLLAKLASSPSHCWAVHRMPCPSRSWLSFLPACWPKPACSPKSAPTSGVSPPRVRCSPIVLPRPVCPILPWAFLDFELSLVDPPAMMCTEMPIFLFGTRVHRGPPAMKPSEENAMDRRSRRS
jgi:hypothetical protein